MAIKKACRIESRVKNTGKECDISMGATSMIICVPPTLKFTEADMKDPVKFMTALLHAAPANRAYPLFGSKAPIRTINNNADSDVTLTLDDGSIVFLRYGMYNRVFETTSGGLCYAQALQSFNKEGFSFLEIDQQGQMLARKNADGTFSGIVSSFMFAPSPILADFTTNVYKNRFQLTYDPSEMINNGIIFEGAAPLLSLTGLIDVKVTKAAAATTTKLRVGVMTECAETNLIDLFPTKIALVSNYVVTDLTSNANVAITAAAVVNGIVELTGSFIGGRTYRVKGSLPSTWLTNGIEGYDATEHFVDITV